MPIFGPKCQFWAKFGRFWAQNPIFWGQGVKILVPLYRDSNETPFSCWKHWSVRLQLAARSKNVLFYILLILLYPGLQLSHLDHPKKILFPSSINQSIIYLLQQTDPGTPFKRICHEFENWRNLHTLSGKFMQQKSCCPESFCFLWLWANIASILLSDGGAQTASQRNRPDCQKMPQRSRKIATTLRQISKIQIKENCWGNLQI